MGRNSSEHKLQKKLRKITIKLFFISLDAPTLSQATVGAHNCMVNLSPFSSRFDELFEQLCGRIVASFFVSLSSLEERKLGQEYLQK